MKNLQASTARREMEGGDNWRREEREKKIFFLTCPSCLGEMFVYPPNFWTNLLPNKGFWIWNWLRDLMVCCATVHKGAMNLLPHFTREQDRLGKVFKIALIEIAAMSRQKRRGVVTALLQRRTPICSALLTHCNCLFLEAFIFIFILIFFIFLSVSSSVAPYFA